MKRILFIATITMMFMASCCTTASARTSVLLDESKIITVLDSIGARVITTIATEQTYNQIQEKLDESFEGGIVPLETVGDTTFFRGVGAYVLDGTKTFYESVKLNAYQIKEDIVHADNFWARVDDAVTWLKTMAANVYMVYRLQYMLLGAVSLLYFLTLLSVFIWAIRFTYKKVIMGDIFKLSAEKDAKYTVNGICIIICLFFGAGIFSADWSNILMLFNPDYYIIQDILSIWK